MPSIGQIFGAIFAVLFVLFAGGIIWLDSLFEESRGQWVSSVAEEVGASSVLAIFAHPDDEQSVAGLLIRARERSGATTRMITATRGEAGSPMPQVSRMEELAIIRHAEVLKNGYALGISEQLVWEYPDGALAEEDFELYVDRLMQQMIAWQADLIVTFWPDSGYSNHPDHRTAGRAATEAVRRLRETDRENAPSAIAYILAPSRMMSRFGGETGRTVVENQPPPTHQMPGEPRAKIRGWSIHASQSDYLRQTYGIPPAILYRLYDKEHYYLVEFDD